MSILRDLEAYHRGGLHALRKRCPPMLVLGAERDILVPPSEVEKAARAYGTAAEIFPGMGHLMMLEAGWQKVADRVIEWIRAGGLDRV